ncbi:carbohydrate ABC transporter permease [Myceligenerans pegani]|uniref:Carbohydrate ABC transporter permease n=1 Tax=Myceligenerans pegani TaxID=2776917 RepID=A0ABR9N5T3_9MICO|nr:carbohydrate ABC transporter permease [Myceligenerans sp. TRM 65318]MBE1878362.1 carbohydrate ABC transporter permease [Myceligenerans sp. TRM 65318]MBE3020633.1 carbohydrate ABC transporter permease [Myceligenerans sp. TRM 65318]
MSTTLITVEASPAAAVAPVRRRRAPRPARVALYAALVALALVYVVPLLWALSSSFKDRSDIFAFPPALWPDSATLGNYTTLLATQPFWSWMLMSTVIAVVSTAATVFFCSLAGFGFAKYEFRGKNLLFDVMFSSMAIPFAVIVVPLFILVAKLGLANPFFALVVPWVAPAFGIFMMRQYTEQSVPDEILDAARIDGCSEFRAFLTVVFPLLRPAVGALAVWSFLNSYNNLLWPLVIVAEPEFYTVPLGLQALFGAEGRQYDLVMAGSVLAAVPALIVFFVLRKQLVNGLTAGAVKG